MKISIAIVAAALISASALGQNTESIFSSYLKVKDALVISDSKATAKSAASLLKEIDAIASFNEKGSLRKAVQNIAKATEVEKQRTAFAEVSTIMWKVVKNSNNIKQDVYYLYCPMKQTYWLSNEATIKNPYYGSKMLTCGTVADKKTR